MSDPDSDYDPSRHETRGRPRGSRNKQRPRDAEQLGISVEESNSASGSSGQRKRGRPPGSKNKRTRDIRDTGSAARQPPQMRPDATDAERLCLVKSAAELMSARFAQNQADSRNFGCFSPITRHIQVNAARECYKANTAIMTEHGRSNVIHTYCYWCQIMCREKEFHQNPWAWQDYYRNLTPENQRLIQVLVDCNQCFPTENSPNNTVLSVPTCKKCHTAMSRQRNKLSGQAILSRRAGFLQPQLRCMHQYPQELKDLTPIEERAISINTPFGYITKLRMDLKWIGTRYRKHVKGHICVFPNNIYDLTTTVLPRTLESTLENFLITWSGKDEPSDKDLSTYTTIRPQVIQKALVWLKENNPIYRNVEIDTEGLSTWTPNRVMSAIRACTQHIEPTVDERVNTAHYTTAEDRGVQNQTEEVMPEDLGIGTSRERTNHNIRNHLSSTESTMIDEDETIYERDSSGVFNTDSSLRSTDIDQLQFAIDALQATIGDTSTTNTQTSDDVGTTANNRDTCTTHTQISEDVGTTANNRGRINLRTTHTSTQYIHVRHGNEFADMNDLDFWPKTFPTLFPHGVGGARKTKLPEATTREEENSVVDNNSRHGFSLRYWSQLCLLRHGSLFARHPFFQFLVFNILVKSNNRRVSMQQMSKSSFDKFKNLWQSLTPERLRNAAREMEDTGKTVDEDIQELMRRLSTFGYSLPLSPEARLQIRQKIQSSIVHFGLPILWFTINPNDLTSPIKKWLSVSQSALPEEFADVSQRMEDYFNRLKFSIEDPVSAVRFFEEELEVFFSKLVQVGQYSCLGKVSHYIGSVETNKRGMLHLHGMIWLTGNLQLPRVVELFSGGQSDPATEEVKADLKRRIETWSDCIFCQTLNEEDAIQVAAEQPDVYTPLDELKSEDPDVAWEALKRDSNRVAYNSQLHRHTETCYKYKTRHCRFGAPWAQVDRTNIGDDCILRLERNHNRVVTYNRAIASAFRHNHDMSFIYTSTRSLAAMYYMTNYATKFDLPMWRRLGYAAQIRELQRSEHNQREMGQTHNNDGFAEQARQFLMRTANRISTEQELSSPETAAYILGFDMFKSHVPNTKKSWAKLSVRQLYFSVLQHWKHARDIVHTQNPLLKIDEGITITPNGVPITHLHAYPHRGPAYETLCLYDYMTMVSFRRLTGSTPLSSPNFVPFPSDCDLSAQWIQETRTSDQGIPTLTATIETKFQSDDKTLPEYAEIQHLGLFVPWNEFMQNNVGKLFDIWINQKNILDERILFHIENCKLLRRSAEDVRVDAKAWADKCAAAEVAANYVADPDDEEGLEETSSTQNEQLTILRDILETETQTGQGLTFLFMLRDQLTHIVDGGEQDMRWETNADPSNCRVTLPDIGGIVKTQRIANHNQLEARFGKGSAEIEMQLDGIPNPDMVYNVEENYNHQIQPSMEIRHLERISWTQAAEHLVTSEHLNHRQSLILQRIAQHLQTTEDTNGQENEDHQLLLYVGGSGGVGKSWLIQAIDKLFLRMDDQHSLCITASTGSAAANINGRTIHSAVGLTIKGVCSRRLEDGLKRRWKETKMLVLDELSMVSGRLFYNVNQRLNFLRGHFDAENVYFGRVPVVMILGDFAQFPPVSANSVIFPAKLGAPRNQSPSPTTKDATEIAPRDITAATEQLAGYKLFQKFTNVIILNEQMRATDPELRVMLQELRDGNPSQEYHRKLNDKVVDLETPVDWEEVRALTPTNATRWRLNMEAVVAFARARGQLVRIFISDHNWADANPTQRLPTISFGDNSWTNVPGIFFYTDYMPVLTNKNQYPGLKLMNGTEFITRGVIPGDSQRPGLCLGEDTVIHFGCPGGILLEPQKTEGIQITGLPRNQILLTPDKITLKPSRNRFKFLTGECNRTGLPCTPAFALTDFKAQGRTFKKILVELTSRLGARGKIDPVSAYVCLSRCKTLAGIQLLKAVATNDWMGLGMPGNLRDVLDDLGRRSDLTLARWLR